MGRPAKTISDLRAEILAGVEVNPSTGCWIWTGSRFNHGAGRIHWRGKARLVHRVQVFLLTSLWPAKVRQSCGNVLCISPRHLRAEYEGVRPMRPLQPEDRVEGGVKLTVPLVQWIRRKHGEGCSAASIYRKIAKRFGLDYVSEGAVRDVCARRTWPEIL